MSSSASVVSVAKPKNIDDEIVAGNLEFVQKWVADGGDVNLSSKIERTTLLMIAAYNGQYAICSFLIQKKCNVNAWNEHGYTAYHYAAFSGHYNICHLLLNSGMNPNYQNVREGGDSLLDDAVINGQYGLCQCLIEKGAEVNANTTIQDCALHYAARYGRVRECELLLGCGATIHVTDLFEETPLHLAARYNHTDICALLLEQYYDEEKKLELVNALNMYDETALDLARDEKVRSVLIENGGRSGNPRDSSLQAMCARFSNIDIEMNSHLMKNM